MDKSTHNPAYQAVLETLKSMREKAGLSQRELAKRLDREMSFVWRIEKGERRLDLLEFFWVCRALEHNPERVYRKLVKAFEAHEDQ